jgi:3-oxosteroid 1-dehydrogenase
LNSSERASNEVQTDVLIVGAGAGGMTAALAARAAGLDVLLVEKSEYFGGSTALSGGGIWVPGATAQVRAGYRPDPDEVFAYLKKITEGEVSDERLRAYVDNSPEVLDFVARHTDVTYVWKPGYPDYFPEVPGGSAKGSLINVEPLDLRKLGPDEGKLRPPAALTPKGMWLRPLELKDFFTIRQSWRGKVVLLRFLWRMLRARLTGERVAAMGQSLAAHLWLGLRGLDTDVWLDSPLKSLITGDDGEVTGAVVEHLGEEVRVSARGGVILATGGFEHNEEMRAEYQPFVPEDQSLGSPANLGDGVRAGEQVGGALHIMDEAWWFPTLSWPSGRKHMLLNERMMPSQFMVNGAGERFVNEATPYSELGHVLIQGQATGTTHIPCWLITDQHTWTHYVIAGHLPIPKVPFAPAPTGSAMVRSWLDEGVVKEGGSWAELAAQIDVPAAALERTAARFNQLAAKGHDDDFGRGDSAYDRYFGDKTLPNPNLAPLQGPPYYAFKIVLGDLGTNGGLLTDERARVLREDGSVIPGLYATGNTSAAVMHRTYAGAGATIGPAMTFGYLAAQDVLGRLREGRPDSVLAEN